MTGLSKAEDKNRKFAALLSLVISAILMFFKFWAHNKTGSEAIYSDAVESIINVVAASLALFVIYYAAKPADEDHPYGHGKVEYFSSAFEGGLISFASALIIINAARSLLGVHELQNLDFGLVVVLGTGVVNALLGVFLLRQGKKYKSVALLASGHHVMSDSLTSAGVGLGVLIIYLTGWNVLDGIIAIIVGAYLGYTGLKLARQSIGGLMDAEDLEVLKQLAQVFEKHVVEGIIQLHHVKVIRSGHYHHIDAHAVLPQFWDVEMVHEKLQAFEHAVIKNYEYGGEMNFHFDPCRQVYCKVCDLKDCAIRKEQFAERIPVDISQLRNREEPEEFR